MEKTIKAHDNISLIWTTIDLSQAKSPHSDPQGGNDAASDSSSTENSRTILMRGNRFDSRDIFQATREIIIAHGEETYRLRLTAQNKLILTK